MRCVIHRGPVSAKDREQPCQANQDNRSSIGEKDNVDEVLGHTEAQDREHERERNHCQDDYTLLPRLSEEIGIELRSKLLNEGNHRIASCNHYEHSWPPGAESCEKPKKTAKGLVCPDVYGAFTGKHAA